MFQRGKICHYVEWPLVLNQPQSDRISKVHRQRHEFGGLTDVGLRTDVPHQFRKFVFIVIDDEDAGRVKRQELFGEAGTYRPGSTEDEDTLATDLCLKPFSVPP